MTIESIRDALPDFARDTKLNLGTVLTPEGAPDLAQNQIYGIALAVAYATKDRGLIESLETDAAAHISEAEHNAAKAAATIMAMNNVYYRFTHYVTDADLAKMPARLRMNVIGSPGIDKKDFELYSLAVSAFNGCGKCMEAHTHELVKAEVAKTSIQSAVRIAAVIAAAAQALAIEAIGAGRAFATAA
jgi:alkyl hydroperoxide reductase subunit D